MRRTTPCTDELTDLVEEAVLKEFEAISDRGGVLGAIETGFQRGQIREQSMFYEHIEHVAPSSASTPSATPPTPASPKR